MKTLTVSEAAGNLADWMKRAMAGEEIAIRNGESMVTLHPVLPGASEDEKLPPRKVLQQLQQSARLTAEQAKDYLDEVRAERLTAD